MKSANSASNCRLVAQALEHAWVEQLKDGGDLVVALGREKVKWSLSGARTAMAALKGCAAER